MSNLKEAKGRVRADALTKMKIVNYLLNEKMR